MAFSATAIAQFESLVPKTAKLEDGSYALTTTTRDSLTPPEGVKIYDTDLGVYYVGDGSTAGGVQEGNKQDVRTYTVAAASAFTNNSTYVTSSAQTAATNSFTATSHGLVVGDQITLMSSDGTAADVGLVVDTTYTVATKADANTFTLTGVTFAGNGTQTLVFRKYSATANNYVTWAGAATLRTGDAITSAQVGTLPSGITGKQYIVKDATTPTATSFRLSDSRAHALAGTDIAVVRSAGAGANTFVATEIYLDTDDTLAVCAAAAAVTVYLPSAVLNPRKKYTVSHGAAGATAVTVKSVAGTVGVTAAATGKALKASTDDFISVVSDGTNWIVVAAQITP